jgi:hypothetical protein
MFTLRMIGTHEHTQMLKHRDFLMLMRVVHTDTTVLQRFKLLVDILIYVSSKYRIFLS